MLGTLSFGVCDKPSNHLSATGLALTRTGVSLLQESDMTASATATRGHSCARKTRVAKQHIP